MMRHVRLLLVALLVALSATSIAEAAPKKVVHRRPRHSSRVSAGAAPSARVTVAKKRAAARKRARVNANRTAAKHHAAKSRALAARRHAAATKPR